ncbi:MAG: PorV/PorQ family protein [Candidatus Latescibacteria bacterium]|nr:PorV/PorQ family protein [Candidatus Latescibacterota bacterium]
MKIRMSIVAGLALVLLFGGTVSADTRKVGGTSMNFLTIDVSARAMGMGSAFSAQTDVGANALFWNLGSMVFVKHAAATFTHTEWLADVRHEAFGIVTSNGERAFGLSAVILRSPEMIRRTVIPADPTNGDAFRFTDAAVGIAYAKRLTDVFSLGGQVKFLNESAGEFSASALALDIGAMYTTDVRGFRIGAVLRNFGNDLKYLPKDLDEYESKTGIKADVEEKKGLLWELPLTFRIGAALEPIDLEVGKLTTAVDIWKTPDQEAIYSLGAEYWLNDYIGVRGGWKAGYEKEDTEGVSYGGSIRFGQAGKEFAVDYALTDFDIFDAVHRVTVGVQF